MTTENIAAAQAFINDALAKIGKFNEQVLRDNLTSHLRVIFPDGEWWVNEHIDVCERKLQYSTTARTKRGFVDNLVGATAIEYEPDLSNASVHRHGLAQVQEYCAGLLQSGAAQDLVVGVLSDTVLWESYEVESFAWSKDAAGQDTVVDKSVKLKLIERLEVKDSTTASAKLLVAFWRRFLGRQGARRLEAETIARDLGLKSKFFAVSYGDLKSTVNAQLVARPEYAIVLKELWKKFVGFVSGSKNPVEFDPASYAAELYVLTLTKLVLANVLSGKALTSTNGELRDILNGVFFETLHIKNLVEYDYFGWMNETGAVEDLLPVARQIQEDVSAYDYRSPPAEDLFGRFLLELPSAKQRILLGQQWTPAWLAAKAVKWTFENLPEGEAPALLDMCCGSGTMVVEALKLRKTQLALTLTPQARYEQLRFTITGFDIDPLAVMLAKASWLLATRDALQPPTAIESIFIPIYNADSLMRVTGVSEEIDAGLERGTVRLEFADQSVNLPAFLVAPACQRQFDALLDSCYPFALSLAASHGVATTADISDIIENSGIDSVANIQPAQLIEATAFASQFIDAVRQLQMQRRNGIWAFVLKNSYRPALVAGQFNGLVSNPPWMALSKLADNPYAKFLGTKAKELDVCPAGSSFHQTELSTVFLLHAVERFLSEGAAYACIVPETVLNGAHQEKFRRGKYLTATKRPVPMSVDEVWRVDSDAFDTNKSVVLCGHRDAEAVPVEGALPGRLVSPSTEVVLAFQVVKATGHQIWTECQPSLIPNGCGDSRFAQGADVFPRRVWFHATTSVPGGRYLLTRIESGSSFEHLVSDEKKGTDFVVPNKRIRAKFFQDVLLSKHLSPFHVSQPDKALLPFVRTAGASWRPLTENELSRDADLGSVMTACLEKFAVVIPKHGATAESALEYVNTKRQKLQGQCYETGELLVVFPASGSDLCAGLVRTASSNLIVDQTLYCARVANEDEAYFLLGMLNSPQINEAITPFQSSGLQTERHIHKLPFLFVPGFNADDDGHMAVAQVTRQLQIEFDSTSSAIASELAPRPALASRRRAIRRFVSELPSYGQYVDICESVLDRP